MGHDIELTIDGEIVASTYISYGWGRQPYGDIFHISDIHGHRGQPVIDHLRQALEKLNHPYRFPKSDLRSDIFLLNKSLFY